MINFDIGIQQNVICECNHPGSTHDGEGCTQTILYTETCECTEFKAKRPHEEVYPGDICKCGWRRNYHNKMRDLSNSGICNNFIKITEAPN